MDEKQQQQDEVTIKLFEGLYNDYVGRLREGWDTTTKRVLDAQRKLHETSIQRFTAAEEWHQATQTSHQDYVAAVRTAWEESQKHYADAYQQYARSYRDAWSKLQPEEISPITMALVGQSATTVAAYAGSTIGNWSLIAWAGVAPHVLTHCG